MDVHFDQDTIASKRHGDLALHPAESHLSANQLRAPKIVRNMTTSAKRASPPEWKLTEQICALVEKTLSPHARIQHDVRLPVLGRRRKRQCDVVITFGDEPRESIAIVEVQKRQRRPDITVFHGWVEKMREVGAQHLFCVSALGFPTSVIDEVRLKYGPTVRLLTLSEVSDAAAFGGVFLVPSMQKTKRLYRIENAGPVEIATTTTIPQIRTETARFSIGRDGPRLDLNGLTKLFLNQAVDERLWPAPHDATPAVLVNCVIGEQHGLFVHVDGLSLLISRWTLNVRVAFEREWIPITVSHQCYKQELADGVLVWISNAVAAIDGRTHGLCITYKPDANGFLAIHSIKFNVEP